MFLMHVLAFAHGQMTEKELESVMLGFLEGEYDVLVSTTIIETGVDIPNVNTLIVNDADRMGLSQLYQLTRTSWAIKSCGICLFHVSEG